MNPFGPALPRNWLGATSRPAYFNNSPPRRRSQPPSTLPPVIDMYSNAVYYPNWRIYRHQPPSSLKLHIISHVFYAFAWVKPDGTVYLSDEWADSQIDVDGVKGCLRSFAALKEQHRHLKLILSVGGGGKGSENFKTVAANPNARRTFAQTARALVDEFRLDGIDIDWEHPANAQEGADYISLLHILRQTLPQPRYMLTSALPVGEWALQHINLAHAATFLDLVNVMTYDYCGTWTDKSGHHAQLFSHDQVAACSHGGVEYFLSHGVPPEKVLLGVPAYGRSFLGAKRAGESYSGVGGEEGTFEYRDLPRPGTVEKVDEKCGAAYCSGGDGGFVTYDNPQTVRMKAKYVKDRKLAGMFYWTATGDADSNERSLVVNGFEGMLR